MIEIRIDGKTEFMGEAKQYVSKPPDMFKDMLRPNATPAPWMKAIAVAFGEAVMSELNMKITVSTGITRWCMEVEILP